MDRPPSCNSYRHCPQYTHHHQCLQRCHYINIFTNTGPCAHSRTIGQVTASICSITRLVCNFDIGQFATRVISPARSTSDLDFATSTSLLTKTTLVSISFSLSVSSVLQNVQLSPPIHDPFPMTTPSALSQASGPRHSNRGGIRKSLASAIAIARNQLSVY